MTELTVGAATVRADQPAAAKPENEKSYTGMLTTVDAQDQAIKVKGWWLRSARRFQLADDCAFVMAAKNPGSFSDLRPGEKIRVNYQNAHGVLITDRIEQQPVRFEGMVTQIDPVKHTLVVHRFGLDKSFQIANGCGVRLSGDRSGTIADVQTGSHVTVTYETPGDEPAAWLIAQTSQDFTGTLTAIDLNERTIKAKASFGTKTFHLGDDCAIVVNGKPDGKLADLKPDENLDFHYDAVNGVNIVNRIAPAAAAKNSSYVSGPVPGYPVPSY